MSEATFTRGQIIVGTLCYALRDDAVLLLQRNRPPQQGKWSPPGGKMELGEAPEECVIREMHEETGLTISQPELRAVVTVFDQEWPIHWLLFIFRVRTFSGTLCESDEGELRWIPLAELDQYNRPYGDSVHWPYIIGEQAGVWRGKFTYHTPHTLLDEQVFSRPNPMP